MKVTLLYALGVSGKTGRALADKLGAKKVAISEVDTYIPACDTLIFWGVSRTPRLAAGSVINQPAAVLRAERKDGALSRVAEAGINAPKIVNMPYPQRTIWRNRFHRGGVGAVILEPGENVDLPEGWFGVEMIDKDEEYRIHVAREHGEVTVLLAQHKIPMGENSDLDIRSHDRGWKFVSYEPKKPGSPLYLVAIKALVTLGLDFAAIDIIREKESGKYFFLEANTAPSLEEGSLEKYVEFFKRRLSEQPARDTRIVWEAPTIQFRTEYRGGHVGTGG